jgi:hypothetical protein
LKYNLYIGKIVLPLLKGQFALDTLLQMEPARTLPAIEYSMASSGKLSVRIDEQTAPALLPVDFPKSSTTNPPTVTIRKYT